MSYEGYEIYVCSNGHRWSRDVYDCYGDNPCPHCGADVAWSCSVDCTNGDYDSPELELVEHAPVCKCCGQTTGPAVYKIPGPEVQAVYVGDQWEE
jgi:hypothetical protein